jgi:molybdopterin converting factor small subunit
MTEVATVLLPGSLLALFPGVVRRHEVAGTTVGEVLLTLDASVPGLRDRLGEPGDLGTPVPAGAVVHVLPAVSGG